jgi:hypothetical protein
VFEHYVKGGAQRGLSPTPLFDLRFVRAQAPDLHCETVFDYLSNAAFASVDPHPFFSRRYYLGAWPDVAAAGADPFHHFIRHGWRERRAIHPFFRAEQYTRFKLAADGDRSQFLARLMAALMSPDLAFGQPMFDAQHYLQSLRTGPEPATPIQDFVGAFQESDGSAFPLFDMEFFLSQAPDVRRGVNPYVEYLSDFSHAADPHPYFDRTFYRHSASVDVQFRGSLLEHFVRVGAAQGARTGPRVLTLSSRPKEDSGWSALLTLTAVSGRQYWLCGVDRQALVSHLSEITSLEPAITPGVLNGYSLHAHSGPLDQHGRLMIATVTKIARCNCLVVSETALEDALIAALHAPSVGFTSNTRPWLTLLACSNPHLRFSHPVQEPSVVGRGDLGGDLGSRARFMAEMALSALPNRLVVVADRLGIALLRGYGTQLLTAIPEVALVVEQSDLEPSDELWFNEYLTVNCCEFSVLAVRGSTIGSLPMQLRQGDRPDMPRILSL